MAPAVRAVTADGGPCHPLAVVGLARAEDPSFPSPPFLPSRLARGDDLTVIVAPHSADLGPPASRCALASSPPFFLFFFPLSSPRVVRYPGWWGGGPKRITTIFFFLAGVITEVSPPANRNASSGNLSFRSAIRSVRFFQPDREADRAGAFFPPLLFFVAG